MTDEGRLAAFRYPGSRRPGIRNDGREKTGVLRSRGDQPGGFVERSPTLGFDPFGAASNVSKRTTPEKRSALDDVSARGASHARSDERPRADVGIGSNPVGRKPCGWRFEGSEVQGATPGSGIRRRRQALRAPRPCTWRRVTRQYK